MPDGPDIPERVYAPDATSVRFTEDESTLAYEIAETTAQYCRENGYEPPPDPMRAVLLAGKWWRDAIAVMARARREADEMLAAGSTKH